MNDRTAPHAPSPVTDDIRALMTSRGIPKKEQSREVARILGLSISQAYKKFSGSADWSMTQIKAIEKEYGAPLMSRGPAGSGTDLRSKAVEVALKIQGATYPAYAVIGSQYATRQTVDFVAVGRPGQWTVIDYPSAPVHEAHYKVEYLEIAVQEPRQYSVAVLDDDVGTADSIADALDQSDFKAFAYYSIEKLEKAMEQEQFDAYVLDWKIGSKTSESLIDTIRTGANSNAPVFLLTGVLHADKEDEIMRIVRAYSVRYLEKPVRMKLLAATIGQGLQDIASS